jgi:hypothetical protein
MCTHARAIADSAELCADSAELCGTRNVPTIEQRGGNRGQEREPRARKPRKKKESHGDG